jgi:RNA 3'-terminal phosphate cyclase
MEPVGQPKIVRTGFSPEGGGEADFSYDEYVEFIEHFRDIAHKIPDEVLEAEKFQAQALARSA